MLILSPAHSILTPIFAISRDQRLLLATPLNNAKSTALKSHGTVKGVFDRVHSHGNNGSQLSCRSQPEVSILSSFVACLNFEQIANRAYVLLYRGCVIALYFCM